MNILSFNSDLLATNFKYISVGKFHFGVSEMAYGVLLSLRLQFISYGVKSVDQYVSGISRVSPVSAITRQNN